MLCNNRNFESCTETRDVVLPPPSQHSGGVRLNSLEKYMPSSTYSTEKNCGLSSKQAYATCAMLLQKANVILAAIACEAMYIDNSGVAKIYPSIVDAIKNIDKAREALSDASIVGSERKFREAYNESLLVCHTSILKLIQANMAIMSPPSAITSAVFLYSSRSIFLVIDALDMLSSQNGEKDVSGFRGKPYSADNEPDDMLCRIKISLSTLVDALDTVSVTAQCSTIEREIVLCSTVMLLHMSRLLRRDTCNAYVRHVVASSLLSNLKLVSEAIAPLVEAADTEEALEAVSCVISSLRTISSEASCYRYFMPDLAKSCLDATSDMKVARLGLLESKCAVALIWNLCREEILESRSHKSIRAALDSIRRALQLCYIEFNEHTERAIEKGGYYSLLLRLDITLEKIQKLDISLPDDPNRISDLKLKAVKAINRVCDMCAKRIKQLEGIDMKAAVNTELDVLQVDICNFQGLPRRNWSHGVCWV